VIGKDEHVAECLRIPMRFCCTGIVYQGIMTDGGHLVSSASINHLCIVWDLVSPRMFWSVCLPFGSFIVSVYHV